MSDPHQAKTVFQTIHAAFAADRRTQEPMNALVVWTELGKGLAGTLEKVGAERGLLRSVIHEYCDTRSGRAQVDLTRWAYMLEPKRRLGKVETGVALRRVQAALEEALPELAAEGAMGDEGRKKLFLTVVRGWFPVGIDIFRALPSGRTAGERELLGALEAWCDRYLPKDGGSPAELGVRVERGSPGERPHEHAHAHVDHAHEEDPDLARFLGHDQGAAGGCGGGADHHCTCGGEGHGAKAAALAQLKLPT